MHPLKQEFGLNLKAKFLTHRVHNASRLANQSFNSVLGNDPKNHI